MKLSPEALRFLSLEYGTESRLQIPVALAHIALEIRQWVSEELKASTERPPETPERKG